MDKLNDFLKAKQPRGDRANNKSVYFNFNG